MSINSQIRQLLNLNKPTNSNPNGNDGSTLQASRTDNLLEVLDSLRSNQPPTSTSSNNDLLAQLNYICGDSGTGGNSMSEQEWRDKLIETEKLFASAGAPLDGNILNRYSYRRSSLQQNNSINTQNQNLNSNSISSQQVDVQNANSLSNNSYHYNGQPPSYGNETLSINLSNNTLNYWENADDNLLINDGPPPPYTP